MAEYIEREAALNRLCNENCGHDYNGNCKNCYTSQFIEYIGAADVAPVVHGRWLDTGYFDHFKNPIFQCSVCRREVADYYIKNHKFCLHCGAKMDLQDNGKEGN